MNETIETDVLKFENFEYQRPDMVQLAADFERLFEAFREADSFEKQFAIFYDINERRFTFTSMYNICHIRHTINTRDGFYEEEN